MKGEGEEGFLRGRLKNVGLACLGPGRVPMLMPNVLLAAYLIFAPFYTHANLGFKILHLRDGAPKKAAVLGALRLPTTYDNQSHSIRPTYTSESSKQALD